MMPDYFKIVHFLYEMGKFPFVLKSIRIPRTSMTADESNKNQNLYSKVYENPTEAKIFTSLSDLVFLI